MTLPAAVITGAPGWLGTRLVLALAQGLPDVPGLKEGNPDRVQRCLVHGNRDISPLKTIKGRIELVPGDLTDPGSLAELFKGIADAVVFHCAGVIHPRRVREFYAVNAFGTRNLVKAAISAGARRFIHISSSSPIGFNPVRAAFLSAVASSRSDPAKYAGSAKAEATIPFDESSPYSPYMSYGKSKKLAEDIVNQAGREGKIETVIVRAPWYYGPGQPERQTRFFRMIKNGTVPIVGDGENLRSMAYVDNLCQGLILCEKIEKAKDQIYWLSDRKPYTMNQIVNTIERVMENDFQIETAHRRRRVPGIISEIALLTDKIIQAIGLYQQGIQVLSEMNKNIFCSISKAETELGYDPKIDLEEGMRRSIKWLLENSVKI